MGLLLHDKVHQILVRGWWSLGTNCCGGGGGGGGLVDEALIQKVQGRTLIQDVGSFQQDTTALGRQ